MTHPIPDEALNSHIGILGKVGSGKTYTAKGLVERLLHLRRHVVIIDPTGAWYGLRTGFEIPIFGGRNGDFEISDKAGEAVAAVIVDQRTSAIIDLSLMTGGGQQRFMRTFAHRLRQKPLGALYLVIDEADEFLPQNVPSDQTNAYGDLRWMVRRGRLSGFRVMMITQRPAEIAKAVLTQIETLVAHRLTAPQDRKAIEEWVKGHHDPAEAREVLNSLASLDKGTAWVWAPDLGILKREAMPPIETFDSSRTPEPGEAEVAPPRLEALDLSAIREALAAVEEPPAAKGGKAPSWPDQREEVARLGADNKRLREQMRQVIAEREDARALIGKIAEIARIAVPVATLLPDIPAPSGGAAAPQPRRERATPPKAAPKPEGGVALGVVSDLPALSRKMIDTLARFYPRALPLEHIAKIAGVSMKSSQWNGNRRGFVESGLVEPFAGRQWRISERGVAELALQPVPEGQAALLQFWVSSVPPSTGAMLREIVAANGAALTREEIAVRAGVSLTSSGLSGGLRELRDHGLIVQEDGLYRASEVLL